MAIRILGTGRRASVGAVGAQLSPTAVEARQSGCVRWFELKTERAQVLRDMGAEVMVCDLLDLIRMHRFYVPAAEAMYFGISVRMPLLIWPQRHSAAVANITA